MAERCGNCGREGTLARLEGVEDLVISERPVTVQHGSGEPWADEVTTNSRILMIQRCSQCEEPSFSTYHWIEGWSDPTDFDDYTRLYPPTRDVSDLPPRVAKRYVAMLELLHTPAAFAVFAGRLLEAICADQGFTEGNLGPRLDQLVAGGRVPKALADQAHLVRDYRNVGGHDDIAEVEQQDVPLLRGFAEALLDFLYWGPAKLERGSVALAERLAAAARANEG